MTERERVNIVSSTTFYLEHFYYGQLVHHEQPDGEPRLLAKSPGVSDETVAMAIKQASLPPVPGALAWSITRGRRVPPLMAQAQQGHFGQSAWHYVVMTPEALRALGGDLSALGTLVQDEMPVFEMLGDLLPLVELKEAAPPSSETLIDNILQLMTDTGNRMQVMEALLSAIVQGVPLVITGAPADFRRRVNFLEGLLALLPQSTRFGITFATHTLASTELDVQIRFLDDDPPPAETLVYQWGDDHVSGREVADDYSHFIISQLRLDAELVIQQTQVLASVTGWRVREGDRLRDALAYASYRRKLDEALLNNLPVETVDVARTLETDPTLTDDLRAAYAHHLLAFTLALGEFEHAEPIGLQLHANPDLARAAFQHLDAAVQTGGAGVVYSLLARWMANPLGPQGAEWVALTHKAALLHLDEQIKEQDIAGIHEVALSLLRADPGLAVGRIAPKTLELLLPLTSYDMLLVEYVFVMAATYLETSAFRKLLEMPSFITRLPKSVVLFAQYLVGQATGNPPAGLLMTAARVFEEEWQPVVVLRLTELALAQGHTDLLDTPALGAVLQAALSPKSAEFAGVLWSIVKHFSGMGLATLEDPGPRYLLQILLALGEYRQLAYEMIRHARELYPGDLQPKYIAMVQRLFAETPLQPDQGLQALQIIHDEGIRAVPYAVAQTGVLEAAGWSPALKSVAENVTRTLHENPKYLEVISADAILALLAYHVEHQDVSDAIRVAGLAPTVAAFQKADGLAMMSRMYRMMDWEDPVRLAALELLRRYVRRAEDREARQAVAYFGRELGAPVQRALEVTYTLKRFMAGRDLSDYTARIHAAAEFLKDSAAAFVDKSHHPLIGDLIGALQGMAGSIAHDERRPTGEQVLTVGRAIVALDRQFRAHAPRSLDQHIDHLLEGRVDPHSALDVFRAMGGYFARGKRLYLRLEPTPGPFADRSAPHLQEDIEFAHEVLSSAAHTFPADKPVRLTAAELRAELDSIWSDVNAEQQRRLARTLAADLQRVPELAAIIAESGDAKALEGGGLGDKLDASRQPPRSTLEFYRFLYGYWKSGR